MQQGNRELLHRRIPLLAQPVWKLKKSKRDEKDILGFDFKIEWACGGGAESALNEQLVLSRSSFFDFSHSLGQKAT